MSIVTLQFGQCGNQVGHSLFGLLEQDSPGSHRWFCRSERGEWRPRAVLVDTETKVVDAVRGRFHGARVVAQPVGGSANNWAFGFQETSRLVGDDVLNCVRLEAERCDFLTSFLGLYSLAGGTGSGVGSHVLARLRDLYPKKTLISCAVLPHAKGEIATQAYNSLLNLAHLYPIANCTVLLANGPNSALAHQMAALLQPIPGVSVGALCSHLAPHPGLRFLQARAPLQGGSKFDAAPHWGALFKGLMHLTPLRLVAQCLIQRGPEALPPALERQFTHSREMVGWVPRAQPLWRAQQSFLHYPRYLARAANGSGVVPPLEQLLEDAWGAFTHGAYVHHYAQLGVDADWFLGAFQWSDVEKSQLLSALRKHGATDLNALRDALPGRSIIDIRRALDHYRQCAHREWATRRTADALSQWIEVMVKLCPERALCIQDVVPRALKYIALFEPRPLAERSDLDLSALYMFLSQLCCEYPTTPLSSRERLLLGAAQRRLAGAQGRAQLREHLAQLDAPHAAPAPNPLGLPPHLLFNKAP